MKTTNKKKDGERISFTVEGVTPQMLNALRRIIISELPVMAIEEVTFYENNSILNDELIAHRLGCIPLKTDTKTYNLPSECTCKGKGCAKCMAILSLEVEGPRTVYAGELKSTDPKITPVYEKTPIIKLIQKQNIKLEAKAQLGCGRDHMKWQAGLASYTEKKKGTFDFVIESYGQMPVNKLVTASFNLFEEKTKTLKETIK